MAGDNVGCLLRGIKREDIERGQVLAASRVVSATYRNFECEVYCSFERRGWSPYTIL